MVDVPYAMELVHAFCRAGNSRQGGDVGTVGSFSWHDDAQLAPATA